ncbi:hypothetical protein KKF34_18020 [Myxococcota bacterium]|nr:hypothetical protein [Myxococcota bacterium]MBU1381182.1 hypothetical protein [Myxococcota bacterium]MBU1498782.1 hypothetical protein [Myxococcota bacterium]
MSNTIISGSTNVLRNMAETAKNVVNHLSTQAEAQKLNTAKPTDTKAEKVLDKISTVVNFAGTEGTAGTVLAPLSILTGLYSLGRAQNVKGREASFKAMASAAAVDWVATNGGRVTPPSEFPTEVQAAVGQGCLGEKASLNAVFHNSRERSTFNTQYKKAINTLRTLAKTPEGQKEIKKLVQEYKQFVRNNPKTSPHAMFMK